MADLQKTVEIIFGGRNDLSKVIGQVDKSLSDLNGASQPFADMADNVLRAETAVVALGVAFAALSINQAGTFGDQFAEITTLVDKNVSELGDYRQAILEYATGSTQSLDSITGAVYSAISAGVDYSAALGIMSQAEQLAVAGKSDLNSTLVALASTLNAYGASADQAADYSDIFFTTVKQGQTTIPELAASLAQVTSTAAAAGVPFDDLSAAIAALTASGLPTSQAITSVKAALSNIIKPSSDAKLAAAELGLQFDVSALKTQGLAGFMDSLWKATGGNIDTMSRLFGSTEALTGVMALAGDKSGIFAKALEEMETRAGATAKAFEKMVDNFGLNNQRLVNNLQAVLIGVGTPLLDDYGDVIDGLVANLKGIGTAVNAGDLDGLIGIFESAMQEISGLLSGIAKNLPEALAGINWSGLSGSFDNLKDSLGGAFKAVFGDIDLGTVDGVKEAIQTLVDLLAGLTNTSAGVIDGMRPLFEAIGILAENFAAADANGQQFAGKILGVGKSVNEITGFLSTATTTVSGLTNALLLLGGSNIISAVASLAAKVGTAGLAGAMTTLGTAAGVAGAATGGWMLGTKINAEINSIVKNFTDGENDSLGGLIYDWLHGGEDNVEFEVQKVTAAVKTIPEVAKQSAADFEAIEWNLDKDGNILGMVTTTQEALDKLAADNSAFTDLKAQFVALGNSPEIAAAMANIELETKRIPDAVEKAKDDVAKKSDQLISELAKIAADERIKTIELAVDLNIEKLKSDTAIMTSIIDGIASTITSTGDLLSSLNDSFLDAGNYREQSFIQDQIEDENKRRDKALELQEKLSTAQVDNLEERTKALKRGDALITINGDGLAPELEAFMFKILEAIQVKVSEDQSQFLLGI